MLVLQKPLHLLKGKCSQTGDSQLILLLGRIHEAIKGLAGLLGLLDVKASISIHELLGSQPEAKQWAS